MSKFKVGDRVTAGGRDGVVQGFDVDGDPWVPRQKFWTVQDDDKVLSTHQALDEAVASAKEALEENDDLTFFIAEVVRVVQRRTVVEVL